MLKIKEGGLPPYQDVVGRVSFWDKYAHSFFQTDIDVKFKGRRKKKKKRNNYIPALPALSLIRRLASSQSSSLCASSAIHASGLLTMLVRYRGSPSSEEMVSAGCFFSCCCSEGGPKLPRLDASCSRSASKVAWLGRV